MDRKEVIKNSHPTHEDLGHAQMIAITASEGALLSYQSEVTSLERGTDVNEATDRTKLAGISGPSSSGSQSVFNAAPNDISNKDIQRSCSSSSNGIETKPGSEGSLLNTTPTQVWNSQSLFSSVPQSTVETHGNTANASEEGLPDRPAQQGNRKRPPSPGNGSRCSKDRVRCREDHDVTDNDVTRRRLNSGIEGSPSSPSCVHNTAQLKPISMQLAISTSVRVQSYLKRQSSKPPAKGKHAHKRPRKECIDAIKAADLIKLARCNPIELTDFSNGLPPWPARSQVQCTPGGSCTAGSQL